MRTNGLPTIAKGNKKEEASHREATASDADATPTTSENVPSTKSSSDTMVTKETENINSGNEDDTGLSANDDKGENFVQSTTKYN